MMVALACKTAALMYRMAVVPWYKLSCRTRERRGSKPARDCPSLIHPEDEVHPLHMQVLERGTLTRTGTGTKPSYHAKPSPVAMQHPWHSTASLSISNQGKRRKGPVVCRRTGSWPANLSPATVVLCPCQHLPVSQPLLTSTFQFSLFL